MANRHRSHEDVTINLTPMIDVVFLLVIFFLVGSKFSESESSINVNVPTVGQMSAMSRTPDKRIVKVMADGTITLDESPLTMEQLGQTLNAQWQAYPGLKVAVLGDAQSSFQRVAEVMNVVSRSGVSQMDIGAKFNARGTMRR